MTRKELLQIPGLGDVLKALDDSPPSMGALEPPHKSPPNLAAPGEIWRVVETDQQTEDQDYSPINPHCSTVLILKREDDLPGEHIAFRAAPILTDIRYCGVEDAIFPREIFGYEAAVACGCEFTLTSKELDRCEGVLPDEWFDRLADFAAWMEAEEGEATPAFPPFLKTGRPFTHTEDPGYKFHSNLATNLQPLMATVLDWAAAAESSEVPGWFNRLRERAGVLAESASELWEACAFRVTPPKPGLGIPLIGATPFGVGFGAVVGMKAHGLRAGAARPFWHLAVGDTGATLLIEQCHSPAGTFALEIIKDPNNRLEGAEVLDGAGHAVATIVAGKSNVPFALEGDLLLVRLGDGTLPPLNEVAAS